MSCQCCLKDRQIKAYRDLFCELNATIRVNRLRGTITSANEGDFDKILDGYFKRLEDIDNWRVE